jgi:hypothetical protein
MKPTTRCAVVRSKCLGVSILMIVGACEPANSASTDLGDGPPLEAVVVAIIGQVAGPAEYTFGDITSVAIDARGRVLISDSFGSEIKIYDADGRFLGRFGREGDGPGEFNAPRDLTFDVSGRLWIRDDSRITVLQPGGAEGDWEVTDTRRFPGYARFTSRRGRVVGDRYLYPDAYLLGDIERYFYLPLGPDGQSADTVPVPGSGLSRTRQAYYWISEGNGRMVFGLNRAPFEPQPSWDVTGAGTVVSGTGGEYRLVETDGAGKVLREFGRPGFPRQTVPHEEWLDSVDAVQQRLDSIPVPLAEINGLSPHIKNRSIPDSLPSFINVFVDAEDRVWVQRWPSATGARFDVYDRSRELVGAVTLSVMLQADPPPFARGEVLVGVLRDVATDVESVAVVRVEALGHE